MVLLSTVMMGVLLIIGFGTNSNVANRVKLATTTELMAGLVRTSFDDLVSEAIEEVVDID